MNDTEKQGQRGVEKSQTRVPGYVGLAAGGAMLIGCAGVVLAGASIIRGEGGEGEGFVGAGTCLIAAALSFGLLLNAFLRR